MNSLKHGLRIERLALPNEDADALRGRLDEWNDFYQPTSPGERALIEIIVTALIQRDRALRFQAAALNDQVRAAEKSWDEAREDEVGGLVRLLATDPATAARALGRTSLGCRWLIARWEHLDGRLERDGGWSQADRDEALRLLGVAPAPEALRGRSDGPAELYRRAGEVELLDEEDPFARFDIREYVLKRYGAEASGRPSWAPSLDGEKEKAESAEVVSWLRAQVAAQLAPLREQEAWLRQVFDEPERAAVGERAMLLEDPAGARWQRYERMHALTFHRAYTTLLKGRKESAETGLPPGAPNEANDIEGPGSNPEGGPICGTGAGPEPAPSPPGPYPKFGEITPRATLARAVAPSEANPAGSRPATQDQYTTSVVATGPVAGGAAAAPGVVLQPEGSVGPSLVAPTPGG